MVDIKLMAGPLCIAHLVEYVFFPQMVESATPDLIVMEWPSPCPLCWVHCLGDPKQSLEQAP